MRPSLENEINRLQIGCRFRLVGNQRPIVPWLKAFDVLVLPSNWEGQPMVLLQALACDVPIVASNIEGNRATLGNAHPGLFSLDDEVSYAQRVRACLEDPVFRAGLLAYQREQWLRQKRFKNYIADICTVYQRILKSKS